MFPGTTFGTPAFIQYGQDDNPASTVDGGDKYVYAISNNGFAYDGSYYILGRVPRSKIGDLNAADCYASVAVDQAPPVLVDTYAPQWEKQQVLVTKDGLSDGKHTITITVTSKQDADSTGIRQDIDAFIVGHAGPS